MAAWRELIYTNELGRREGWHLGVAGSALWKDTTLPMPDAAAFLNNYIGFVWCRRTVEIPESWVGRDLILKLGSVDEEDVTYVNGVEVGRTVDKNKWQVPRQYPVPAAAVTGRTVRLALSVMNEIGGIGVFGAENDYSLAPATPAEGDKPVSVAGAWQYAFGGPVDQKGKPRIHVPGVPGASWDVSTLYNAMVAPLLPYAARGAIWYQGESNSGQPDEYAELLPALIRSWRKGWGEEFDFLFVQLANFMTRQRAPVESQSWADLRESQRRTLSVPRTGMAVIIDIGEANDIHPRNKQDVGKRLALWALARTYGRKGLVYSGPLYRDLKVEGARATVRFDHAGGGLVARGEPLTGFAVAGSDRVFHAAQARLEGSTVVVSSDQVPAPVAVRYGWASNPICNLYNKEGLPASPFRTDNWPGLSVRPADEMLSEPRP
jgi:sialate O-acetylesterase